MSNSITGCAELDRIAEYIPDLPKKQWLRRVHRPDGESQRRHINEYVHNCSPEDMRKIIQAFVELKQENASLKTILGYQQEQTNGHPSDRPQG